MPSEDAFEYVFNQPTMKGSATIPIDFFKKLMLLSKAAGTEEALNKYLAKEKPDVIIHPSVV